MLARLSVLLAAATLTAACGAATTPAATQPATAAPSASPTTSTVPATFPAPTTSTTVAPATTSTTVAPTTTTVPAPTPAEQYLAWLAPSNCLTSQLVAAEDELIGDDGFNQSEWPTVRARLQPLLKDLADATAVWIGQLVAYAWPTDVQAEIDTLVAALADDAQQYVTAAEVTTLTAWNAAWATAPRADSTATSTVIRAKLGLPTNINDTTTDWCAAQT